MMKAATDRHSAAIPADIPALLIGDPGWRGQWRMAVKQGPRSFEHLLWGNEQLGQRTRNFFARTPEFGYPYYR